MDDDRYAALTNNAIVAGLLRRGERAEPGLHGRVRAHRGSPQIIVTPNLPVTSTVIVADSTQLGAWPTRCRPPRVRQDGPRRRDQVDPQGRGRQVTPAGPSHHGAGRAGAGCGLPHHRRLRRRHGYVPRDRPLRRRGARRRVRRRAPRGVRGWGSSTRPRHAGAPRAPSSPARSSRSARQTRTSTRRSRSRRRPATRPARPPRSSALPGGDGASEPSPSPPPRPHVLLVGGDPSWSPCPRCCTRGPPRRPRWWRHRWPRLGLGHVRHHLPHSSYTPSIAHVFQSDLTNELGTATGTPRVVSPSRRRSSRRPPRTPGPSQPRRRRRTRSADRAPRDPQRVPVPLRRRGHVRYPS